MDWAAASLEGLNGLVNNAGILRDGLLVKRHRDSGEVTKLPTEQWQSVIDVNLTGATLMARDVAAKMVAAGDARGPRQPFVDRAAWQSRSDQLRRGQGRARRQLCHLGARAWTLWHPGRWHCTGNDRDPDDGGNEREGA